MSVLGRRLALSGALKFPVELFTPEDSQVETDPTSGLKAFYVKLLIIGVLI